MPYLPRIIWHSLKKCKLYISKLEAAGKLIAAQPIMREGVVISRKEGDWASAAINPTKEVQVGYYHILANDMAEAIEIAKENPSLNMRLLQPLR